MFPIPVTAVWTVPQAHFLYFLSLKVQNPVLPMCSLETFVLCIFSNLLLEHGLELVQPCSSLVAGEAHPAPGT